MTKKPTYAELERKIQGFEKAASKQKQTQEALRESEERFKTLSNLTFEGILIHNNGVVIDLNDTVTRMLGYTREELTGKNIIQLCVLPEYHAVIQENIVKNSVKPYEVLVRRKDATVFPVEIEARDIKDKNKKFRVTAIRDITERKQAEDALKKNEQELRSIFRAAPTGIGVVCDRALQQVNDRFCEITGYSQNELIGQSARMLYLSDEDFEYVGKEKYQQIANKGTGTVETKFKCKNGKIINVLLSSTPIDLDDLSKGVTFTALDITSLKEKELEL
ncbi:MAG: PAS domain-containing protein, partial [Desulfobacterales bacterium]|nr:PAS domain-containing protein [Desulfobacterales bacterium]